MAIDFKIHVCGLQALREKQIGMFGWPATIPVENKILSKYLTQHVNPRFLGDGLTFDPFANAYVHECNAQTGGKLKIVKFSSAGKTFEDYVTEQINLTTDEILLKSLLTMATHGDIDVPSMADIDTLTQLKGKTVTSGDQPGLAAGMAILRNPALPSGHLDPNADIEFPNLASMGDAGVVGKTFGDAAVEAVS
jgi:hypothetical protein